MMSVEAHRKFKCWFQHPLCLWVCLDFPVMQVLHRSWQNAGAEDVALELAELWIRGARARGDGETAAFRGRSSLPLAVAAHHRCRVDDNLVGAARSLGSPFAGAARRALVGMLLRHSRA